METSQPTLSLTSPSTEVFATNSNPVRPPTETSQATRDDESTQTESDIAVSDHTDQSPETHTRTSNHESSSQSTPRQSFQKKDPLQDTAFQASNHTHPRMRRTHSCWLSSQASSNIFFTATSFPGIISTNEFPRFFSSYGQKAACC